jgi:hypothetical protein
VGLGGPSQLLSCSEIVFFKNNLGAGAWRNFARKKKKKIYSVFWAEGKESPFFRGKKNRQI